ncbi:MAG: alkaline shock response membrane anchor protein AmaP [Candidatus Omnitrophica bacterium]|nr:alkaline shock response membrane anchor protein AmaP [Candidatus Omnitrophota bacterium]
MRFFSGLTLFFYTLVFLLVGGVCVAISLDLVPQDSIIEALNAVYVSTNTRLIIGITGLLLILISLMVTRITIGKMQRERTIAFENQDGQVTISLAAIEDFIKRAARQMPEIKDLRPSVRAEKKGISVIARVTLFSDINIPETTEKIQSIVKSRVQEMLGLEEKTTVRVDVTKIVHKDDIAKGERREEKPSKFRGNIEYTSY